MRVVGGGAGQHQLDEADDHREVVCQEVDGLGVKRDRPGRRDICTQFAATSLFRVHAGLAVGARRSACRTITDNNHENGAPC